MVVFKMSFQFSFDGNKATEEFVKYKGQDWIENHSPEEVFFEQRKFWIKNYAPKEELNEYLDNCKITLSIKEIVDMLNLVKTDSKNMDCIIEDIRNKIIDTMLDDNYSDLW